jgi:hypothetical protein
MNISLFVQDSSVFMATVAGTSVRTHVPASHSKPGWKSGSFEAISLIIAALALNGTLFATC